MIGRLYAPRSIRCGPVPGMLKVIVSAPGWNSALASASKSVPGPTAAVDVTTVDPDGATSRAGAENSLVLLALSVAVSTTVSPGLGFQPGVMTMENWAAPAASVVAGNVRTTRGPCGDAAGIR